MLDVQRRIDVDAGGEQFLDIHVALGMPAARRIGVRELVDQNELRPALEDRVEVHFVEPAALVLDPPPRDDFEPFEQRLGLLAAMRLDDADDDIDAFAPLRLRGLQHFIGLADARRGAEKNLQPAAARLARASAAALRAEGRRSVFGDRVIVLMRASGILSADAMARSVSSI